jgi:hypothetical protein
MPKPKLKLRIRKTDDFLSQKRKRLRRHFAKDEDRLMRRGERGGGGYLAKRWKASVAWVCEMSLRIVSQEG